jgi:membrane protease YdiL (CAAX protease family)
MELDDPFEESEIKKKLPFNNLYLNAGVVNGLNEWWMYVMGIVAAVFGYLLAQVFMVFPLMAAAANNGITMSDIQSNPEILFDAAKIGMNKNIMLALLFSMFLFTFAGLMVVVRRVHKKTLTSIVTAYDKIRWKRFFFAFGIWALLLIVSVVLSYFLNPGEVKIQFDPVNFLFLVVVCVILMPIQTSTEELLFRGYLMQGLSQVFRNGIIPLIVTSLLFGLVHMENPEAKTYGWMTMLPYYAAFGFFLGALTLLDEGLELAMGIHCANNLISSLLITSPNGVLKTDAIFVASGEDPGAEFITWSVMALITFIIFWRKYRWKNFNLLIK